MEAVIKGATQETGEQIYDIYADDPRWIVADRIASSQNFIKSQRMGAFLRHIVRFSLEGRAEELTEQQLGVHVFGRAPGYNPSEDNIVRTTARQLRQRLALYYQEEGFADSIRIQVPRGGYLPIFFSAESPNQSTSAELPSPAAMVPEAMPGEAANARAYALPHSGFTWRSAARYAAVLLIGGVLFIFLDRSVGRPHRSPSATDPLWNEIFSSRKTTVFVPGDAGLNMYNLYSGRTQQLSLREYINAEKQPLPIENLDTKQVYDLDMKAFITYSDLKLAHQITKLASYREDHFAIYSPRDVISDNFRNASAILCGAPPYNPWVEIFDGKLNFHLLFNSLDHSMKVINRHPQKGEQPAYVYQTDPNYALGYGYIALTDNLEGNGKVLLIEGTGYTGVDASLSFLFNDKKMAPIMAQAKDSHGKLQNFEVLLQAPFIKYSAGDVTVVATRFHIDN
jgi:hypothetical protein